MFLSFVIHLTVCLKHGSVKFCEHHVQYTKIFNRPRNNDVGSPGLYAQITLHKKLYINPFASILTSVFYQFGYVFVDKGRVTFVPLCDVASCVAASQ